MDKKGLLTQWANSVVGACHSGALTGDATKPIPISQVALVPGPRAGALGLHAGLKSGDLVRIFSKDDAAILRQFVPWNFVGEPACYMSGRYVRVEAGWPDELADRDIKLRDLGQHPKHGGRWLAGRNEYGGTVTLGLHDQTPSFLFAGTTGSGKSWALVSAVGQLCQDPDNKIVLIDGKFGDGLLPVANVANLVGPLATDLETGRAALSWSVSEMRRRYSERDLKGRVIVVIDEVQELTTKDDVCTDLIRRLTSQGRGAKVFTILATHHPVASMLGGQSTIKNTVPGRLALKVLNAKASEVAMGDSTPRADHLLGAGDAYAKTPKACYRAQLAYIPENELVALPRSDPLLTEWESFDPECMGTMPEPESATGFDATETAISLIAAHYGKGRPFLKDMLENVTGSKPGSSRAGRLRDWGREINVLLHKYHHRLTMTD